jgi:hypothetical protein
MLHSVIVRLYSFEVKINGLEKVHLWGQKVLERVCMLSCHPEILALDQ